MTKQTELTATLMVGDFSAYCARCTEGAFAEDTHHTRTPGGRRDRPCGARFTAMRSVNGRGKEHLLRALRPDLPIV